MDKNEQVIDLLEKIVSNLEKCQIMDNEIHEMFDKIAKEEVTIKEFSLLLSFIGKQNKLRNEELDAINLLLKRMGEYSKHNVVEFEDLGKKFNHE